MKIRAGILTGLGIALALACGETTDPSAGPGIGGTESGGGRLRVWVVNHPPGLPSALTA